jgi:diamine N-acetyltransferase
MVYLRKITWANLNECIALDVTEDQQNFIDSNVYALAQAYVACTNDDFPPISYAIYNESETVVGLVILVHRHARENKYYHQNCYEVISFMIGKQFQGKGYGREAFKQVLEEIEKFPEGKAKYIFLSYDPKNEVAKRLYASYGFVETGIINSLGEQVAKLPI